ncbi:MAG: OmpA family protein [Novosphingobium sp.]
MKPLVSAALLPLAAISAPVAAQPLGERPVPVHDGWAMGKPSSPGEKAWWCLTNPGKCFAGSPKPKGKSSVSLPEPPPPMSTPPIPGASEDPCRAGPYTVYFDFDRTDISPEAAHVLDGAMAELAKCGAVQISVEGHADAPGTREYNIAISERRAAGVKNYLLAKGLAQDRVSTVAYGEERPAVISENDGREPQNRRAQLIFVPQ